MRDREMVALQALVLGDGPWKFGVKDDEDPDPYSLCLVCGQPWSCHRTWECPDEKHIKDGSCSGQSHMRGLARRARS